MANLADLLMMQPLGQSVVILGPDAACRRGRRQVGLAIGCLSYKGFAARDVGVSQETIRSNFVWPCNVDISSQA